MIIALVWFTLPKVTQAALSTPTVRNNTLVDGIDAQAQTTGTFSIDANDLIIFTWHVLSGNGIDSLGTVTITDTFGNLTWTVIREGNNAFNDMQNTGAAWAIAGSDTSGTITLTYSLAEPGGLNWNLQTFTFSGHDTVTPIRQSTTITDGGGTTVTSTLGLTPLSTSAVVGVIGTETDAGGITPGTGFTEIYDTQTTSGFIDIRLQTMYDLTDADTTADWSSLAPHHAFAFEVAAAASSVQNPPAKVSIMTPVFINAPLFIN